MKDSKVFQHPYFRYADQVSVGDEVLIQGYDKLLPTKVINTSDLMLQGIYSYLKVLFSSSHTLIISLFKNHNTISPVFPLYLIIKFSEHCFNYVLFKRSQYHNLSFNQVHILPWLQKETSLLMDYQLPAILLLIMMWLTLAWQQ